MTPKSSSKTIACWRIYPEADNLFAEETLLPSDDSILIRQGEETDEYLRGYITHPRHGSSLHEATFQKDKLVGWREETVLLIDPVPPLWTRVGRRLRAFLPGSHTSEAAEEEEPNGGETVRTDA